MSVLLRVMKLLLALNVLLAVPFAQANTVQYTLTILGLVQHNYPDSIFYPTSINDNGIVAGYARVRVPYNPSRTDRGVLWQSSTHYTILGTISESSSEDSMANAINASGIAAGFSLENTGSSYVQHPVMFTPTGVVNLGVKNAFGGYATGINNASQVVGIFYFIRPVFTCEAFVYQNGVMAPLGYPVPTNGYSQAYAINNNGLIVGSARFSAGSLPHAASYANGAWTDLGTLGSGSNFTGTAYSVNDSGVIVGTWTNMYQGGMFIYQNGQITNFAEPTAYYGFSYPVVNNVGEITFRNFIYQNGGWQDLNALIEPCSGWTISYAAAINNEGVIAGTIFKLYQGVDVFRACLLTPVSSTQQPARPSP
jgi:probable HAF family extracellular repeat protein